MHLKALLSLFAPAWHGPDASVRRGATAVRASGGTTSNRRDPSQLPEEERPKLMSESPVIAHATEVDPKQASDCPTHPASSRVPCARCGTFMCTECAGSSGGLCASCRQRVLVDPSALNERVRDATGLLYLNCATSGLAVVCFILAAAFSSEAWLNIYSVVVFAGFILFWGSAITFLKWEHFTVRGVNALGH